jgi:hypothetical protein
MSGMTDAWVNAAIAVVSIAGMVLVHWHNRREWAKLRRRLREQPYSTAGIEQRCGYGGS